MYTITYEGGEPLQGVGQNGCLFTTTSALTRESFGVVLRNVVVSGEVPEGETDLRGTYPYMRCVYFYDAGGHREFALKEYSSEELERKRLEGNIEYIAMMTGVEL